jgi:hypothetical protein
MFLPQALSGLTFFGLPFWVDPLGAGLEVADHRGLRHALALTVKDETPTSYLPALDAEDDRVEGGGTHSVLTPNLAMTASKRSTSMPMTVLPSASRYSLGW